MRDRLIELLKQADEREKNRMITDYTEAVADNADFLLANGVIVPPVRVGDTVYQTDGVRTYKSEVKEVIYDCGIVAFDESAIGNSVFLTKEEAEKSLAERSE